MAEGNAETRRRKDATDLFLRVGRGLTAGVEARRLLEMVIDAVLEISGADRALAVLFAEGDRLEARVSRHMPTWDCNDPESVVGTVARSVAESGVPLCVADATMDRKFAQCRDHGAHRAVLCLPLWRGREETLGVLYLESDNPGRFEDDLVGLMAGLADLMALTVTHSQRQEDELQTIYDSVQSGLFVVDVRGAILRANRFGLELFGLAESGATGGDLLTMFGEDVPDLRNVFQIALRTGKRTSASFSLEGTGGSHCHFEASVTPLPERGEELMLLVSVDDRTERERLVASAAQREKMAAVGLLAAGVAHEFNNIWSAVHGYAELAKQDERYLHQLADVTLEQARRASEIVQSLLSFSEKRIESRQGIPVAELVGGVIKLVQTEFDAKRVAVGFSFKGEAYVSGDEGQLQQVVLQVLLNAYHAVQTGGHGDVTVGADDRHALIRVVDDGAGMTPEELEQVFVPFYTTKGALGGSDQVEGQGLGLTLAYNIVRTHGGAIRAESHKGRGTVVSVELPLDMEVGRREGKSVPVGADGDGVKGGARRFLVVDDEVVLHGLLRSILRDHLVDAVTRGEEALEALQGSEYDAAFVDLVLGGDMTGFELLHEMERAGVRVPVIVITGRQEDPQVEAWRGKIVGVVRKPFTIRDIHQAVDLAVQGGREDRGQ